MRAWYPLPRPVAAILLLAAPLFLVCAAPFKTSEEKIPKHVVEVVQKQIGGYFPTNDFSREFNGIPLLDPKIEWNEFANWPDEFTFGSDTYSLKLTVRSGGDYVWEPRSRREVKRGMTFSVSYRKKGTQDWGLVSPWGEWGRDGSVSGKGLHFNREDVLGYRFYPTGALYFFLRHDFATNEYRTEYFDPKGRLVGVSSSKGGKAPSQYTWKGVKVSPDTFAKRSQKLLWSVKP